MASDLTSWSGKAPEQWAAFYVRVTQEESVKTDLSIPNQIARAHEIATSRKWAHYQIYVEPRHVSGELWIEKRPGLMRVVEDVRAGRVTRVCARHTDRLWRNAEIQSKLLPILREHGVELWDYSNQHDYRSAHGRFSLQVLGAASELEVNLTAERIREMKRGKAQRGQVGGGPPPFGYTSQSRRVLELRAAGYSADDAYATACTDLPIGKRWYIDEAEAAIVRLIFELYTAPQHRLGSLRIAQYLNANGHKSRNGYIWLANYVRRVVDNPAYAGFTSYDESAYAEKVASKQPRSRQQLFPGEHPPIVTPDLWRQAQAIKVTENPTKRGRGSEPTGPAPERNVFTLSGILRCPKCGHQMTGKGAGRASNRTYYQCSLRHHAGRDQCDFPLLDAKQVQEGVWNCLHEIFTSPAFVEQQLESLRARLAAEQPESDKRENALVRRRDEVKAALGKYHRLFESSRDPARDAALLERVKELGGEQERIEKELADLQQHRVIRLPVRLTEERVRAYLERLRARMDQRPEHQKALFAEMQREHGLQVRPASKSEIVVSLALPMREVVEEQVAVAAGGSRVYAVLAGGPVGKRSDGPGSPEPGPMDHAITIEHRFRLGRGSATAADWAAAENAKGRVCACGCGGRIRVLARHRWHGVPRYLRAHHPMRMSVEVADLRAGGFMTTKDAARVLGIGATTLIRMEGSEFIAVPRRGRRGMRVFSEAVVEQVRERLQQSTLAGRAAAIAAASGLRLAR